MESCFRLWGMYLWLVTKRTLQHQGSGSPDPGLSLLQTTERFMDLSVVLWRRYIKKIWETLHTLVLFYLRSTLSGWLIMSLSFFFVYMFINDSLKTCHELWQYSGDISTQNKMRRVLVWCLKFRYGVYMFDMSKLMNIYSTLDLLYRLIA